MAVIAKVYTALIWCILFVPVSLVRRGLSQSRWPMDQDGSWVQCGSTHRGLALRVFLRLLSLCLMPLRMLLSGKRIRTGSPYRAASSNESNVEHAGETPSPFRYTMH
jgi:hypothetical protein